MTKFQECCERALRYDVVLASEIVPGIFYRKKLDRRGDQLERRLHFVEGAEWVMRSMDEDRRRVQLRKMCGAELRGLLGRMERV